MSSKGNDCRSSRRSSESPSMTSVSQDLTTTRSSNENFPIGNENQDNDGGKSTTTTATTTSSSSKPFIWKPLEYPVQEQTIRPSQISQDINTVTTDPETFAVPTDAEMASLTAKECPILIRPKSSGERHASTSSTNRKR